MESGLFSQLWGQGGVDYTVSPFPEHNYWSCPIEHNYWSCPIGVACESYLVESRRPLWFSPHKLISLCQVLIHRHSPLAAVSCSTLIISLRLASRASLSSLFKSLLRWSPLFSRSVESGFSMVWSQGSAEYTASLFPEHNCWSCGTGF